MFYAHSRPGQTECEWDVLEAHLERTAQRARQFLPPAPEFAYLAGLWHDVGKYQTEFQTYLHESSEASDERVSGKIQHSIVGAALAERLLKDSTVSMMLAWVIAAHHGSLADRNALIKNVRKEGIPRLDACLGNIPRHILDPSPLACLPETLHDQSAVMLWIRMLLSALGDADMLDTEAWSNRADRENKFAPLTVLRNRLDSALKAKKEELRRQGTGGSPINIMRAQVLDACLQMAKEPTGQFTLTVPTGGGKTLSSLAFALHHACRYNLRRVIVVIPYTSIIEQTADEFRRVLGEENVVEHHSSLDMEKDTLTNQRACENWDAPIIITTSVQFLESLYSSRKTSCRKLHSIADSVVVLDEVQTFPVGLLAPIRRILGLLSRYFGTTVVHCTATQPTPEPGVEIGPRMDPEPRPIITDPRPFFAVVKNRFCVVMEGGIDQSLPLQELAEKLQQHSRVMAIVHSRKDAEQLAKMVEGCWHLSARMCAAHRRQVLGRVRETLWAKQPCRLIATQLIEAGVDISFPVVFRALAGLETLAQAAGRCNRELDGEQPGEFHIFRATSRPPSNSLRRELEVSVAFLKRPGFELDLNDPALFSEYFRCVLDERIVNTDAAGIATCEREFDFPSVDEKFRMIEENGHSVLAPFGRWKELLARLRHEGPSRQSLRALQRYFVQLYDKEIEELHTLGVIEPLYKGAARAWAVCEGAEYIYSEQYGFGWQGRKNPEPEHLIA